MHRTPPRAPLPLPAHGPDPAAIPVPETWRDQLIDLDLPGVGAITACGNPQLFRPAVPEEGHETAEATLASEDERGDERRRRRLLPTSPPPAEEVRATLRGRNRVVLEHTWLVLPALGPVLPTLDEEVVVAADLSGRTPPFEVRRPPRRPQTAPSPEGAAAGAPEPGDDRPRRRPPAGWFLVPAVAAALQERAGTVATGALVGPRRDWFEPAVGVREDLLAAHPDQALESALAVAREHGQHAVIRIGAEGLDVIPTGCDPRVPELRGLQLLVTPRAPSCPLRSEDCTAPCRPVGGPWIARAHRARIHWEARRAQALAALRCGICFGQPLPPAEGQSPTARLAPRTPIPDLAVLHLRDGRIVHIDPLSGPRRDQER